MKQKLEPLAAPEQMVAAALNEQGFLLSQVVREKIRFDRPGQGQPQQTWAYRESEYPVTASDGSQTRIDIVLSHVERRGVHLCIECKRAHPLYKRWVFFDNAYAVGGGAKVEVFIETFKVTQRPINSKAHATHAIEPWRNPPSCQVFNSYLEVAINRERRAGYTETIEDAFLQVIKGHTGLMFKLLTFDSEHFYSSIPVVVTTAQLFEVRFDPGCVSLASGTIDRADLTLRPMQFCAVNYHPDDRLALKSDYVAVRRTSIENDVLQCQTRTIFVVQAEEIVHFLNWLDANIVNPR